MDDLTEPEAVVQLSESDLQYLVQLLVEHGANDALDAKLTEALERCE